MLVGSSFAVLNFFYFQLLNPNASLQDISSVLSILSSCVCHFPGPTGPFRVSNFFMAGFTNKSDEWQQENWNITTNGSPLLSQHFDISETQTPFFVPEPAENNTFVKLA